MLQHISYPLTGYPACLPVKGNLLFCLHLPHSAHLGKCIINMQIGITRLHFGCELLCWILAKSFLPAGNINIKIFNQVLSPKDRDHAFKLFQIFYLLDTRLPTDTFFRVTDSFPSLFHLIWMVNKKHFPVVSFFFHSHKNCPGLFKPCQIVKVCIGGKRKHLISSILFAFPGKNKSHGIIFQ